jgi:hypothetical protein
MDLGRMYAMLRMQRKAEKRVNGPPPARIILPIFAMMRYTYPAWTHRKS